VTQSSAHWLRKLREKGNRGFAVALVLLHDLWDRGRYSESCNYRLYRRWKRQACGRGERYGCAH